MNAGGSFIVVGSYPDPLQAHIARGQLESAGIPARLADEYMVWNDWLMSQAMRGVKLLAPAERAEEAIQVLAAPPLPDEDFPVEKDSCPACGSEQLQEERTGWKLALLSVHLLQLPLPFSRGHYHCLACGKVFQR